MCSLVFNYFVCLLTEWWSWVSVFSDTLCLQALILYILILLLTNTNPYYTLLYLFLSICLLGLFLGLYQMDFFTGFLWVVEFTLVFIGILLLFYLNVTGFFSSVLSHMDRVLLYLIVILYVTLYAKHGSFFDYERDLSVNFDIMVVWTDYYEALHNTNVNDFLALTIMYYSLNSMEFILLGLLLFLGTLVCSSLNLAQKQFRLLSVGSYLDTFTLQNRLVNFRFMRRQSLTAQVARPASLRLFKRKK